MSAAALQRELVTGAVSTELASTIQQLGTICERADGAAPFNDQTLVELHKAAERDDVVTLCVAWQPDENGRTLAGAAVVVHGGDPADEDAGPDVLELAVHPEFRERGTATALVDHLDAELIRPGSPSAQRAWGHGAHPGAPAVAARFGWAPVRELWKMRLENDVDLAQAPLPDQVKLRGFVPGQDEAAWLSVNSEAFADHPEQGRITREDLQMRMAQDWFSAEGFLLAEETDREGAGILLGFHWTKISDPGNANAADTPAEDGDEKLGEVYAVGVAPEAQGRKLGAALTVAGIEHLRGQGVDAVILYVDADNTAAVRLYQKLGFTVATTDTQYAPVVEPAAEPA